MWIPNLGIAYTYSVCGLSNGRYRLCGLVFL